MLHLFAQESFDSDFTTTTELTPEAQTGLLAVGGFMLVVWLAVLVVMVVSMWKIFEKAGKPGWAAIVPVYNMWVLAEISGKPGWWALIILVCMLPFISFIGWIPIIVLTILIDIGTVKAFGKDPVWALMLIFLPVVGYPMLAFGKDTYTKPA